MSHTIVIQSHRSPLPYPWLRQCIESVKAWAEYNKFDYHFFGDELFADVPADILEKTTNQKVIATDLGRLKIIQKLLAQKYQTVIWCDADFLVFSPKEFTLPNISELSENYAVGREVWIQKDDNKRNRFKSYIKVHNAFLLFRSGNNFLNFYIEHAERLLRKTTGSIPPQFIGPKLLTALHNVVQCPVIETAGMLSPVVLTEILQGEGKAIELFKQKSPAPILAANLCSSLFGKEGIDNREMEQIVDRLQKYEKI